MLLVQIPGLGKGKRESREGLRRLVSAKANSCGQNLVKSAGDPRSCVGLVPAVLKAAGIFCRTGHSKSLCHLLCGLILQTPFLLSRS